MRILFVTPTGGLTGSEMMLWYLLRQLAAQGHEVAFFSMQRGKLHQQAANVPFQTVFYGQKRGFVPDFYAGVYKKVFNKLPVEEALINFHRQFKPDFWYLNTITLPHVAELARSLGVPYVVHFHELLSSLDEQPAPVFDRMLSGASRLIGCSESVCQRIRQLGYDNVNLLYSCIDTERIQVNTKLALRAELGILPDAFIWLMSGTVSLRKGFDLVPDIVEHLPPNVCFLWVGKDKNSALTTYVRQRSQRENLPIKLLAEQGDLYYDYLNVCDGFVLTSREDPFPLVMIEAAALGKPIAAFNSGGVSEFLQPGMGTVVNSFWPADLAAAMTAIMTGQTAVLPETSRKRASEFNAKRLVDDWLEIFVQ